MRENIDLFMLQVALAKLVVKRFLPLVALLDRAAQAPNLPVNAPLLFKKGSKLKASGQVSGTGLHPTVASSFNPSHNPQVLTEFLQSRLVGEGDVGRTLARLGYKVAYVQDPRWELEFSSECCHASV